MSNAVTTTYRNRKFTLLKSTGYFLDNDKTAPERLLHRLIWADANGAIPPGMVVHHRDGCQRNNAIENLELKPSGVHTSDHMKEYYAKTPGAKKNAVTYLAKARKTCHDWLRTPQGKDWCREHVAKLREVAKTKTYVCLCCHKEFEASAFCRPAKYCSLECKNTWRYMTIKSAATSKCEVCGKEFKHSLYFKPKTCSKECRKQIKGV